MEKVIPPQSELSPQMTSLQSSFPPIKYIPGDAVTLQEAGKRPAILAHSCNSVGQWGKGFVMEIQRRWKTPRQEYLKLPVPIQKGFVQFVEVEPGITVANMIGQGNPNEASPVDYEAIRTALATVRTKAIESGAAVHMPRIGSGLGRGDWSIVEKLVQDEISSHGVDVIVYTKTPSHVRVGGKIFKREN